MEGSKEEKRRKDRKDDEDQYQRERKAKRARSRSRSPAKTNEGDSKRKRKRSRSGSREKRVKEERQRDAEPKEADVKKEAPVRKNKDTDMLNTRTGGAYIPPARLRMMQAQITDKSSAAFQRLAWEALKKSIHGHINKINVGNIGIIIKELLKENIVRGRGLLCRSVIQAQAASPTFTNVYAALVAAVNSRFPNIGELLLKRLVIQFKRGFKRNDKPICISSASFIAHLVNQRVAHEILALELLTLLVETPTDDSVEVAIAFLKECGQKLTEVSSKGVNAIFEMLRNILHEGQLDKRVQYMIEVMFQVWKDGFKDHPALIEELELVPEEEQFTHLLMLDDATDPQDILNVFKLDDKYEENEQKYKTLCKEILGSDAESDGEEESGESGSGEESDDEEEESEKKTTIIDNTETNLVALRRTIYLTINSSLDFEECAHKLMKMQLKPGQEIELCHMFLDCCAEQRTYEKFYGLLAQRFCNINKMYIGPFEEIFKDSYGTAHRLDTNRLRNVSKFFAHLLFTDSISWEVLECVKLNEEDTTSSSRIYIKILFQELAEYMGLKKLNDRLKDPTLQEAFHGIFPRDNPKNTRFSINFFTSIGLGGLTDELREHLKQMPKNVPPPITEINLDSESSSSSSSSSDSSSDSSSSSDSENEEEDGTKKKSKKKNKNKDKEPKTPEEPAPDKSERWGHDGFYDTYGKDARRNESRPNVDGDFVRPRDRRDNWNDRRRDDRGGDNRDDRGGDRRDERVGDRRGDRNGDRRDERSGERRDDRNVDRREDRSGERRDDRSGERRDDRGLDRREDRGGERRDERTVDRRDDRNGDRRDDRGGDRRDERVGDKRDDRREDRGREKRDERSGDKRDDRVGDRRDDREDRRDDRGVDRRDERGGERRENRPDKEDRRREYDRQNDKDDDRHNDTRRLDRDVGRHRDERNDDGDRRREDRTDENRKNKDQSRKYDRNAEEDSRRRDEDDRSKKDRDKRNKNRESDEDRRTEADDSRKRDQTDKNRKEKDKRSKNRESDEENKQKYDSRKPSKDDRSKERKRNKDREEEDSRSRFNEKEIKKSRKESKKSSRKESESESSSSSDSEDDRSRRREKDKKRDKYLDDDGWDIRGSSVRREISLGRYWQN